MKGLMKIIGMILGILGLSAKATANEKKLKSRRLIIKLKKLKKKRLRFREKRL